MAQGPFRVVKLGNDRAVSEAHAPPDCPDHYPTAYHRALAPWGGTRMHHAGDTSTLEGKLDGHTEPKWKVWKAPVDSCIPLMHTIQPPEWRMAPDHTPCSHSQCGTRPVGDRWSITVSSAPLPYRQHNAFKEHWHSAFSSLMRATHDKQLSV